MYLLQEALSEKIADVSNSENANPENGNPENGDDSCVIGWSTLR